MKKIKGLGLKCYEIDDFDKNSKEFYKIVTEQIQFLLEVDSERFQDAIDKSEEMQTPWFLESMVWDMHSDEILESIRINEYYFDYKGELLPFVSEVDKNGNIVQEYFHGCPVTLIDCTKERV